MAAQPALSQISGAGVVVLPGPGLLFSATSPNQLKTDWGGPIQYLAKNPAYIVTQTGTINNGVSTTANLFYGGVSGKNYYLHWSGFLGTATPLSDNTNNLSLFFYGATLDTDISSWSGVSFYARGSGDFLVQIVGPGLATGQEGPYTNYNYYSYVFGNPGTTSAWRQYVVHFSQMTQLFGTATPLGPVLQQCWGLCFQQNAPFESYFGLDLDDVRLF